MPLLLLVQDKHNTSVQLLAKAFERQHVPVTTFNITNTKFVTDKSVAGLTDGHTHLPCKDIDLLIRTSGPLGKEGLLLCKALEAQGVPIVNGTNFMEWCYSKIQQYRSIEKTPNVTLFPKTYCFEQGEIEGLLQTTGSDSQALAKRMYDRVSSDLSFPPILKKNRGCGADGVYRLDSLQALEFDYQHQNLDRMKKRF